METVLDALLPVVEAAISAERERCARIAEEYGTPNRFDVHKTWAYDVSPAEVYDTAAQDVGNWIAAAIRAA